MRQNIQRTEQRGDNLDHMQTQTEDLAGKARGFNRGANRMRKQLKMKNMRLGFFILLGIIVLIIVIVLSSSHFFSQT